MARYNAVFNGGFIPKCKPDGTFSEVQCHDGECWCVNTATGEEMGSTRSTQTQQLNCKCESCISCIVLHGHYFTALLGGL